MESLDALDLALLTALDEDARVGALELSRATGVARATVSARLRRLEEGGVITAYRADVDVAAAGFGVEAFVTLEIAQGAIEDIQRDLEAIPGVLEAHATTGSGDVLCRLAASSHGRASTSAEGMPEWYSSEESDEKPSSPISSS